MKPRIVFLVDKPGWAFDQVARAISARLENKYDFRIYTLIDSVPELDETQFDLLYVFFWGEQYYRRFNIDPKKIIKEVASYRWLTDEYGALSPEQFVTRYLTDCNVVTTPSKVLWHQLTRYREAVYHCRNGFEPSIFRKGDGPVGPLKIGWVGNPRDPLKGLHEILIPATAGRFDFRYSPGTWTSAEVSRFYNEIDVLAVASVSESQPLPLLEALACGCTAVSTNVGIVSELVGAGAQIKVVDRTVEGFINAFQECERELPSLRSGREYNAKLLLRERSWDVVIDDFDALFETVLKSQSHPEKYYMNVIASSEYPDVVSPIEELKEQEADYAAHLRVIQTASYEDAYQASRSYYQRELMPVLPQNKGARILEIGSGYGHLLRFLRENHYQRLGAVDRSRDLISHVRQTLGDALEFAFHADAVSFLTANREAFDVIVMFDLIEHIPVQYLEAFVTAQYRALRPGGRIIIRTPNMASMFGSYSRYIDFTHCIGFTEFSLAYLLRLGGFGEPKLHQPVVLGGAIDRWKAKLMTKLQKGILRAQDRTVPECVDKNLIMWAEKD